MRKTQVIAEVRSKVPRSPVNAINRVEKRNPIARIWARTIPRKCRQRCQDHKKFVESDRKQHLIQRKRKTIQQGLVKNEG